jgi:serine O-acetyltransferase
VRNPLFLISSDLRAKAKWMYDDTSPRAIAKTLLTDGTFAMIIYRCMQASQQWSLAPLAMVFNKINGILGGCIIGRGASFEEGLVFIHSDGIVINGNVRGGSHVHLEHQVTIGAAERDQFPVLGNRIFVGAGAKIIGPVRIGSDVRIGANAVVIKDVPDGATAVGVPARNIERQRGEAV